MAIPSSTRGQKSPRNDEKLHEIDHDVLFSPELLDCFPWIAAARDHLLVHSVGDSDKSFLSSDSISPRWQIVVLTPRTGHKETSSAHHGREVVSECSCQAAPGPAFVYPVAGPQADPETFLNISYRPENRWLFTRGKVRILSAPSSFAVGDYRIFLIVSFDQVPDCCFLFDSHILSGHTVLI